jgi:hypothetical protein
MVSPLPSAKTSLTSSMACPISPATLSSTEMASHCCQDHRRQRRPAALRKPSVSRGCTVWELGSNTDLLDDQSQYARTSSASIITRCRSMTKVITSCQQLMLQYVAAANFGPGKRANGWKGETLYRAIARRYANQRRPTSIVRPRVTSDCQSDYLCKRATTKGKAPNVEDRQRHIRHLLLYIGQTCSRLIDYQLTLFQTTYV